MRDSSSVNSRWSSSMAASAAGSNHMRRIEEGVARDETPKRGATSSPGTSVRSRASPYRPPLGRTSSPLPPPPPPPPPPPLKENKENRETSPSRHMKLDRAGHRDSRKVSFTNQSISSVTLEPSCFPEETPSMIEEEVLYEDDEDAFEVVKQDSEEPQEEPQEEQASILKHQSPARPVISRTSGQLDLITSEKMYAAPTRLHEICYKAKKVDQLMDFIRSPDVRGRDLATSATRKDLVGRIPLHVFAENHSLAGSLFAPPDVTDMAALGQMSSFGNSENSNDRQLSTFVLEALLSSNPSLLIWRDADDFIPFERSLVEWTRRIYSKSISKSQKSSFSRRKSGATDTLHNVWVSTSMSVSTAMHWAGRSLHFNSNPQMEEDDRTIITAIDPEAPIQFPTSPVRLTSLVRFAFKMLSLLLDQLDAASTRNPSEKIVRGLDADSFDEAMDSFRNICQTNSSEEVFHDIVEKIAKIPNLVLSVFLLEDDEEREWVLRTKLFQRIAIHHQSVGPWINFTLQNSDKMVARRGMEYLQYASKTVESPLTGPTIQHDAFLEATSKLEGFIPSLLALEERQIEDASTTFIVRSVLDKMISRPFATSVVFGDFFFLCLLIMGFRYSVNNFLLGESPEVVIKWIYLANIGIFFFIIREIGKCITIVERTRQASIYLWSFWNIADILCTLLALSSTLAIRATFSIKVDFDNIDTLRALLAVTTGLLWLRSLSLLKSLNIQLATFVLAILQICKDILWFLMILGVLVASFAQMFYTMLIPATCATGDSSHESNRECSQAEYYLRVYNILGDLGDFQKFAREDFPTTFSVLLVVFFSFLVVIVLLNVLIAIVSDSYEKCLVRSHYLFGRARVLLIAELSSFQNLLRTHPELKRELRDGETWCCQQYLFNRGWSRGSIAFFLISAFVILVWLVGETAGYYFGGKHGSFIFSLLSVLVNVLLFAAIVTFLSRGDEMHSSNQIEMAGKSKWQEFMYRLLGTSQETGSYFRKGETDEWRGRLNYLQQEMEQIAEENRISVASQIKCMEHNVTVSETKLHNEIVNMEGSVSDLRHDIMMELAEMEKRNMATMQELLQAVSGGSPSSPFLSRTFRKRL